MNILEQIIERGRLEIQTRAARKPLALLKGIPSRLIVDSGHPLGH